MTMAVRSWPITLLAVVLSACSSQWAVEKYQAPGADVASLRTFAWKPGEYAAPRQVSPELEASLDAQLRDTITGELRARGYTELTDPGAADMHITVHVSGMRREVLADESRIGAPTANAALTPGEGDVAPPSAIPQIQTLSDASVIVFADDPTSGRLMWRGTVTTEGRVTSKEAGLRKLDEIARDISRQFPARRGTP
jgi:Domain of unknown function (DUF4136)